MSKKIKKSRLKKSKKGGVTHNYVNVPFQYLTSSASYFGREAGKNKYAYYSLNRNGNILIGTINKTKEKFVFQNSNDAKRFFNSFSEGFNSDI